MEFLPLDQEFLKASWLRVEQNGDNLAFLINGEHQLPNGIGVLEDNGAITFEVDYGAVVDYVAGAVPPDAFLYSSATVNRQAYLDDAMRIVFEDLYEANGHDLSCRHVFEQFG